MRRRAAARQALQLTERDFVLLLIGNDWKTKGLETLFKAIAAHRNLPLKLLVAGQDERAPFLDQVRLLDLESKVQFLQPSPDVLGPARTHG